jgi:chondroitin AC lyase
MEHDKTSTGALSPPADAMNNQRDTPPPCDISTDNASTPIKLVRQQFIAHATKRPTPGPAVKKLQQTLQDDGTWSDVDYTDQSRAEWTTMNHLYKVQQMAHAYADTSSRYHQDPEMKHAVIKALNHWLNVDYQNPNWWYTQIGLPQSVTKIMLLLGDALPEATAQRAHKTILTRTEMGLTGQNKVWLAGIALMKALLTENPAILQIASNSIWSELHVSLHEGIQPDWSFHQHGPQQQFGNYGLSFAEDMLKWALILRNSPYAPNPHKLEILRNYLVKGLTWVLWNDRVDYNACGRQIDVGSPESKARALRHILQEMQIADPTAKEAYKNALKWPNTVTGNRFFWRSDMAVHRRPQWYASVKMSSTRVVGSETCNSENVLGIHGGDGALMLYGDHTPYREMPAILDWHRLPGTTCDQGNDALTPNGPCDTYGLSEFVGGLSHQTCGIAAMIFKRNDLSAHKAWFFNEKSITCLGSNIHGETMGTVLTSIEQSLRQGEIQTSKGCYHSGELSLPAGAWVHHNTVGYHLLCPTSLQVATVDGNWNPIFPDGGDRPVTGEVLSLWTDHGQSPSNASYAYVLYPQTLPKQMVKLSQQAHLQILSNGSTLQAIQQPNLIQAVFYAEGTAHASNGQIIKVNAPCILSITNDTFAISDPTQSLKQLKVTIGKQRFSIDLPQGPKAGNSVSQKHSTVLF